MKKLLSLAVIMLLCCTSFLMFGCSVDNGSMTITLANPAFTISQKTIDEGMDYIDAVDEALKTITIVVDYKDAAGNEKQWTGNLFEAKQEGASVTGFSLKSNTGSSGREARVTMFGVTEVFTYTVTVTADAE